MGLEGWVGIAVLVNEMSMPKKVVIVCREPSHMSVFDDAAKEVGMNSTYTSASNRSSITKGWTFLKVDFIVHKK